MKQDTELSSWLTAILASGVRVEEIAHRTGFSVSTIWRWRRDPRSRANVHFRKTVKRMYEEIKKEEGENGNGNPNP